MKKVLIITYYWPPSGGAGVQRWLKFVKYLPSEGIEPIVLTVDPHFAAYPVIDKSFGKDIQSELKVYRTQATDYYKFYSIFQKGKKAPQGGIPSVQKSFKSKLSLALRNHLFVPDPRIGWNKYAFKKAEDIIRAEGVEIVITTSPPHSTQLIGVALKKKYPNLKWIADLRDPWTDIYYYKDLNHSIWSDKQNRKKEKLVLQTADEIVVVSKGLKELFRNKGVEIQPEKIHVVSNGYDHDDFALLSKATLKKSTISYVGTINDSYDISGFLKGLRKLSFENKGQISFQFVGQLSADVEFEIKNSGLNSILQNKGYVEHAKAVEFIFSSDVLLLVIPKVEGNKGILTGKLFEYIATGNPILCIGPKDGDASKVISEGGFGECFDYSDSEGIYLYLRRALIEKSIESSPIEQREKYTRENLTKELAKLIK